MLTQALTSEPGIRSRLKEFHYAQTARGSPQRHGRPLSSTICPGLCNCRWLVTSLRLARPADFALSSLMAFSRPDFALALRSWRRALSAVERQRVPDERAEDQASSIFF
jgi:hypothetical protein